MRLDGEEGTPACLYFSPLVSQPSDVARLIRPAGDSTNERATRFSRVGLTSGTRSSLSRRVPPRLARLRDSQRRPDRRAWRISSTPRRIVARLPSARRQTSRRRVLLACGQSPKDVPCRSSFHLSEREETPAVRRAPGPSRGGMLLRGDLPAWDSTYKPRLCFANPGACSGGRGRGLTRANWALEGFQVCVGIFVYLKLGD